MTPDEFDEAETPDEQEAREEAQAEALADAHATEWVNQALALHHTLRAQTRYEHGMGW